MSIYDKASLIQIPSGYKASKLYSVIPNSGAGDFTVTGDPEGEATRVNSQGLIENVSANVPRLDYPFIDGEVQDCPHLLLEPQRTNNTAYSEDFSSWGDVGVTITSSAIVSPDGTTNASKLVSTANNWRKSSSFSGSAGVTYTVSIYAKLDTSTSTTTTRLEVYNGAGSLAADYNLLNETISNSGFTSVFIEPVEDDWYRIGGTYTAGGTNNILYIYPSAGYGTAGTMYFWGAQQEAGSYPTSYIKTIGLSVTRLVDSSHLFNHSLFTDYPFTVYAKAEAKATPNDIFSLVDNTSTTEYLLFQLSSSTQVAVIRRNPTTSDADYYAFSYSIGDTLKVAISYISATSYKLYINGTQVGNVTSGSSLPFAYPDILLGQQRVALDTGRRNPIDEFMVFNEALSDSELETLTSYSSFNSMATALGYKII